MNKNYVMEYLNENEFRKKERAIKKYNMLAYKKLIFDFYPSLREGNFLGVIDSDNEGDGTTKYALKLPTDPSIAARHLVGLANNGGGYYIVGVRETPKGGDLIGIEETNNRIDTIAKSDLFVSVDDTDITIISKYGNKNLKRTANIKTNANKTHPNTYTRPGQTATSTTNTPTVQRGQYGQGRGTPASTTTTTNTTSQVYRDRGNQKNVKPPTKIGNSQSYSGNRNQPKRPDASANYKPKARSPEPGTLKRKTINRGKPVENIQITHIIFSSRPTDFHITEELNLDNLNSGPIKISQSDRARLKRSGKVVSTCSCDGVEIAKPRKVNLKGNTTHYQHARGIGMTDDRKDNINPMFYSSEIKKLDPIYKPKEKEKVEYIEIFRSSGQVRSKSPTTTKTMTKTTTNYNMGGGSKYTQNQNYRSGVTKTSTNNRGASSSTSGRGATNTTSNKGGVGTTVRTTSNYTRTTNTGGASGRDGEIIKETNTKVQMGSRSFKNQSQPTTYTTTERKVYNQKSFFKNN